MSPPTVNAYFNPPMNDINFPAGVLQPPLYDAKMDDAPNYPKMPDRAWVARETNAHIRLLAKSLRDETPVGFFCECGCFELVTTTVAEFDAGRGIYLPGHRQRPAERRPIPVA